MFFDLAKSSIYYRKGQRCATQINFFLPLTVSAVEPPKIIHHGE